MPEDNCAIPGCSTSRATPGVELLGMPKNDDEYNVNWGKNIVHMITKIWVVDTCLKRQIQRKSLHFCDKHYPEEKLIRCKYKIMTHYNCSKLCLQKILVDVRKKIEKARAILQQQFSNHYYYTLFN